MGDNEPRGRVSRIIGLESDVASVVFGSRQDSSYLRGSFAPVLLSRLPVTRSLHDSPSVSRVFLRLARPPSTPRGDREIRYWVTATLRCLIVGSRVATEQ